MKKISVFGDLMCEPSLLKASKKKDGTYDFSPVFSQIKPMIAESDFCIGNLEFPMAGKDAKYTDTFVEFNTPDSYAIAVKDAGFDLVATVNNHTLDRGWDGAVRTLKVLDEIGLDHTGNFYSKDDRKEAFYFELEGKKYAVISYTYSCNLHLPVGDERIGAINLLRDMEMPTYTPEIYKKMNSWVEKVFKGVKEETQAQIRRVVGLPPVIIRGDDSMVADMVAPYMANLKADVEKAKENADCVIAYLHLGGQFNIEPGVFSKFVMNEITKMGVDMVIASHSHLVQRAEMINGVPCAYSIGNVTMCPWSPLMVKEVLPDYAIVLHLYVEEGKIVKTTFSIIKGVEKKGEQLVSYPVDVLYEKKGTDKKQLEEDVKVIYKQFLCKELTEEIIRKEYPFEV